MSEQDKTTMSAEEVLQKFDKESDKRNLTGMWDKLISFICIAFAVFQLYTATFGVLDAHLQRAIHLAFGFSLIYLLYPGRKNWSRSVMHPLDVIFAVLSVASALYIVIFYDELVLRAGMNTEFDFSIAFIGTLLLFEAARRVVGWPMLTVALFFMFYAFAGPYMPGILAHRGVGVQEMFDHLFFTTEGIFGTPLGVSSTFIYLFILFGSYLEATGLGKLFIDLANAVAGWAAGGPAKVAVLSSGLMGTVSGSSVANVAGTGAFTIPMMKKLGYRPAFAGAVEAAASTGGQLMPPVMGAAAFLMAEFVGVPYIEVVKAAVIPALLYYIGVWIGVHYEAKKFGLKGTPRDQLPKFGKLFMEKGHSILLLASIVYLLIEGSKGVLGVLIACATAGVIIGVVTKTGVGLKLATALLDLAGGHLLPAMFFTMITSLILGMGVPTTANYVITSTIAAPALVQMDVPVLAAHMFAFYFGIVADVTPPVALAAYAGAGISGADPMKTGFAAAKLAIAAFIVPYIFVLAPELLMIDATPFTITFACATAIIGMWGVSVAMIGFCQSKLSFLQRLLFFVGGLNMIIPGAVTDAIGVAILAVAFFWQRMNKNKGPIENHGEDL